jgi:hypothetical protein
VNGEFVSDFLREKGGLIEAASSPAEAGQRHGDDNIGRQARGFEASRHGLGEVRRQDAMVAELESMDESPNLAFVAEYRAQVA